LKIIEGKVIAITALNDVELPIPCYDVAYPENANPHNLFFNDLKELLHRKVRVTLQDLGPSSDPIDEENQPPSDYVQRYDDETTKAN
jgi:hypothetical protein